MFSEGYLNTDSVFLQLKSATPIARLEDLKGKTIAVNKGSSYERWAMANASKYGFKYESYGSNSDAIQAILAGRADTNLDANTVSGWAAKKDPALKITYTISTGVVSALAFRPDDKAGRDRISMALKCMKHDGYVAKLAQKWFGFTPGPDSAAVVVVPGQGVPGLSGYDPIPVKLTCNE